MAKRSRLFIHQTKLILLFTLTVVACIINAIITLVSFVIHVRTQHAARSEPSSREDAEHTCRMARLDRKERFYQVLHFITLWLFILFGVLILIQLSHRFNGHGAIL